MFGYVSPEVAAWLTLQQQQTLEADQNDDKLIKVKPKQPRCMSCGKFLNLNDAHMNILPMGYGHMTEPCITYMINKIRSTVVNWDWDKQGASMTLKNEDNNAERNSGIQTEGEGDREVQAQEG